MVRLEIPQERRVAGFTYMIGTSSSTRAELLGVFAGVEFCVEPSGGGRSFLKSILA